MKEVSPQTGMRNVNHFAEIEIHRRYIQFAWRETRATSTAYIHTTPIFNIIRAHIQKLSRILHAIFYSRILAVDLICHSDQFSILSAKFSSAITATRMNVLRFDLVTCWFNPRDGSNSSQHFNRTIIWTNQYVIITHNSQILIFITERY